MTITFRCNGFKRSLTSSPPTVPEEGGDAVEVHIQAMGKVATTISIWALLSKKA